MTRKDIFIMILSEVSGKQKTFVSKMFDNFRAANPGKWDDEIPEPEAEKLLNDLRAEFPGILKWLNEIGKEYFPDRHAWDDRFLAW